MLLGFVSLLVLVGGFGSWATFSSLSGAIIASGQIEVEKNRQVVQHPDGGVVAKILVKEGDFIQRDAVLVRLDPIAEQSEMSIIEGQLFEMMARHGRLVAERDALAEIVFDKRLLNRAATHPEVDELMQGQHRLFEARRSSINHQSEQLEKQKEQVQNQITGLAAQRRALGIQLALTEDELKNQQTLFDRGLTQAAKVLDPKRTAAQLSGQIGDLSARSAQAGARITELNIQLDALQTQRREQAISDLRDQQFRFLELEERHRALQQKLARMDIKAPVSGIVYGLVVHAPRSVIRPADPVLYLIPQDRPLVIAARIEPIHIDQIFLGQEVALRFSALDQRNTPELYGIVTIISADAFQDQKGQEPFYRAEIVLRDGELERLPPGLTLIPGMPVEAFIRTAARSPLNYFLKPLSNYFIRAFRKT
ncbi:MAG: HlyD family type I secretion periplasmic adaptor subunit [Paracoccaceae bacterium]